jgi:predicted NBD/HSP70 family sugar kinase
MAAKASVRDVRRTNRALLVRHLLLAGETSRSGVGVDTGLSPATVTSVINELLDERTVREEGFLDSVGGRRRVIVGLNPEAAILFGADVGETRVTTAAFDLTLGRLGQHSEYFAGRRITPERVGQIIGEHVGSLLTELAVDRSMVLGLGLGVPGIVENPASPTGEPMSIVHAEVLGWKAATFDNLATTLGFPVYTDNGAKTTTQAEAWYGSAKDIDHAIVVLIGDGAGAGIITNGRLYRGSSSSAGEWGHTKISLDGIRCRCGSYGCVETFVGASAVLERWRGRDDAWIGRETEGIEALLAAVEGGDPHAVDATRSLIEHLGLALSNLVNLYNPQKIIIGGWFGDQIAERFLNDIGATMRRFSLEQPGREAALERSTLGQGAVTLGAATLPLDRFIELGWPARNGAPHASKSTLSPP